MVPKLAVSKRNIERLEQKISVEFDGVLIEVSQTYFMETRAHFIIHCISEDLPYKSLDLQGTATDTKLINTKKEYLQFYS